MSKSKNDAPERGVSGKKRREFEDFETKVYPPLSFRAKPHDKKHDNRCKVCTHEDKDLIEDFYVRVYALEEIVSQFELTNEKVLKRHAEATKLDERRANNTEGFERLIMEKGEEAIRSGAVKPEILAQLAVKISAHKDDKSGKLPTRGRQTDQLPSFAIMPVLLPGGGIPGMQYPQVIQVEAQVVEDEANTDAIASLPAVNIEDPEEEADA